MSSAARRVKRLSVTAPTDALARRATWLIEDGLRVATMPASSRSGHLLVRSLRLRGIRPDATSILVAQQIERAMREAAISAVCLNDPRVASAPAVRLRDALEPYRVAIARLAAGRPLAGWPWRALFGWNGEPSVDAALLAILESAVETLEQAALAASVFQEVARRGLGPRLLAAATPQVAKRWIERLAWREGITAIGAPLADGDSVHPMSAREQPQAWIAPDLRATLLTLPSGSHADARALLWTSMAVLARHPAMSLASASAIAQRLTAVANEPARAPLREATKLHLVTESAVPAPPAFDEDGRSEHVFAASAEEAGARAAPRSSGADLEMHAKPIEDGGAREDTRPPLDPHGERTTLGGLWFLLPILSRLGLAAQIESSPLFGESDPAARILLGVARRLARASSDAALIDLEARVEAAAPAPVDFVLPPPAAALLAVPAHRRAPTALVDAWIVALRRHVRRTLGVGLHRIVARRALAVLTRTHVDVFFSLHQVDIPIRAAGLDIDPHWLSWFGRVVTFHYE